MGHNVRGLGASPSQSFSSLTSLPIFLPQPLGSEAFKSLSQVCPGPSFIPVGPDRGFGRAQRAILKLSYPKAPRHGWAHFFLALSLSLPTPLLLLRPLSYSPFSPLPKDMPSPCALHSSLASFVYPIPSPFLPPPLQSRAGRCYWCFFTSGPSSKFVFGVSPPHTSFSLSLDPRA